MTLGVSCVHHKLALGSKQTTQPNHEPGLGQKLQIEPKSNAKIAACRRYSHENENSSAHALQKEEEQTLFS